MVKRVLAILVAMLIPSALMTTPAFASFQATCFGHTGVFRDNTRIAVAYWDGDLYYDECFGISPDRRIYHVWRASPGWVEMPNNGRADNMSDPGYYDIGIERYVFVLDPPDGLVPLASS